MVGDGVQRVFFLLNTLILSKAVGVKVCLRKIDCLFLRVFLFLFCFLHCISVYLFAAVSLTAYLCQRRHRMRQQQKGEQGMQSAGDQIQL